MDILFINAPSPQPSIYEAQRIQGLVPLGLGYMASYIKQYGYFAHIMDFFLPNVNEKVLLDYLKADHPHMVGISTSTDTYNCGIELAKVVKKYDTNIIVVMGGYHVTFIDDAPIKTGYVDIVSRGEGEITIKELCDFYIRGIGDLSSIDGITYMVDGEITRNRDRKFISNLDELPFPDRTMYDIKQYSAPASISTSRGCPGRCIFCAATALSGGKYRVRSAENVIEEFKYLKSLGHKMVHIIDDTMTANVKRLNRFIDLMIEEDLGMNWYCESRIDIVTKELLIKMKKAGCVFIQFGVEAGNQKMLDCLKKNITIEQIWQVFTWCKELGIDTATCFIVGQPFETFESITESVKLAIGLQNLGARIVFSISTPYPGTEMYENASNYGIEIIDHNFDNYTTYIPVYNIKNMTAEQIQTCYFDAFYALFQANKQSKIRESAKEA